MSGEFTSWDAAISALKDKIALHIAGEPFAATVTNGPHSLQFNTIDQAIAWIQSMMRLKEIENPSGRFGRVLHGRYIREGK